MRVTVLSRKRIAVLFLFVCVPLGAFANSAVVAWQYGDLGNSSMTGAQLPMPPDSPLAWLNRWRGRMPDNCVAPNSLMIGTFRNIPAYSQSVGYTSSPDPIHGSAIQSICHWGYPFPAFQTIHRDSGAEAALKRCDSDQLNELFEKGLRVPLWSNRSIVIPLAPVFPGFLGNTLLFATVASPFVFVPCLPGAIRRSRMKRNRCPRCGYSLAGLASDVRCPECGEERR